jgi:FixJ family two-component response regulator
VRTIKAGAEDFLTKPVSSDELFWAMNELWCIMKRRVA